jgi:hypothetical protein
MHSQSFLCYKFGPAEFVSHLLCYKFLFSGLAYIISSFCKPHVANNLHYRSVVNKEFFG